MARTMGIEREQFITKDGIVVPAIATLLPALKKECRRRGLSEERFSFELFAGQIEDRTPPAPTEEMLMVHLLENEAILETVGKSLDLGYACREYLPEAALGQLIANPFEVRHQEIWNRISRAKRVSASQVAAIHIHFSATAEEAVSVLNYCRADVIDGLSRLGDSSSGARLEAYRAMAQVYGDSPLFLDTGRLLTYIEGSGGEKNVWDLVRYKPSTGTIEFRMFGTTADHALIRRYIAAAQEVIRQAMK